MNHEGTAWLKWQHVRNRNKRKATKEGGQTEAADCVVQQYEKRTELVTAEW